MIYSIPLLLVSFFAADPVQSHSPADQLAALAQEGIAIRDNFRAELKQAGHDMPKVIEANNKYRADASDWVERASVPLKAHPAEPAALDVILAMNEIFYVKDYAVAILRKHHFASPKVLALVGRFCQDSPGARRQFAEDVAGRHPDRSVRGKATLTLGQMDRIYLIDGLKKNPGFGGRLGKPDELRARARRYLQSVERDYADVKSEEEGATLGELAKDELAGLDNVGRLEVGNVAPDIAWEDLDTKPLKLSAKSGKVTLLVFWGSWCGPCMRLVPHEAALAKKYADRPFQLYGVNGGDERKLAKKTVIDKKMAWPIFYGGRVRDGLAAVWDVDAWPAVYVIDPEGVIRYKGDGDGLEDAVEKAVAEAEKRPAKATSAKESAPPRVSAKAWAIADGKTGKVLWGFKEAEPRAVASTTKIMTALLVLRLAEDDPKLLDEEMVFSARSAAVPGSSCGLRTGERLPVRELLYGMLLPSGNDAAVAFAEHFGPRFKTGSQKEEDPVKLFVAEMNREAKKLKLSQTSFLDPNGLARNKASASDLALLTWTAMQNKLFREYVSTRRHKYAVVGKEGQKREVTWTSTNKLLGEDGYDGVKTGTTNAAGACLVASGSKGGDRLIVVVLGASPSDARYTDSRALFQWAWQKRAAAKPKG
jgi:D-alanyl-D-alanine carboxypeptidase (penicillin-binding protein 5/6)